MDVRIGQIDATVVDTEGDAMNDASIEKIARRVLALIALRERSEARARHDRTIASPDNDDMERYG